MSHPVVKTLVRIADAKQEARLKAAVTKELKRQEPGIVIQHFATRGSPDRSLTHGGITTHWEFKHGTPNFQSPGDQELMCMRLAAAGHCRYVLWMEDKKSGLKMTIIAHPRDVHERTSWWVLPESWGVGFDIPWLVKQMRLAHTF